MVISDTDLNQPLTRAQLALTGLALGDAVGAFFEFSQGKLSHYITNRKLPEGIWHWTDDTQMALSIYAVLRQCSRIDQDLLATSLAYRYERSRGYAGSGATQRRSRLVNKPGHRLQPERSVLHPKRRAAAGRRKHPASPLSSRKQPIPLDSDP